MAASLEVSIGDRRVTVRELSVTEVRDWIAEHETGQVPIDPVRAMVFDDCSLDDLARMCDMPADSMEEFGPVALGPLHDACKALNPHFFKLREALVSVSRAIQAGLASTTSTALSQD